MNLNSDVVLDLNIFHVENHLLPSFMKVRSEDCFEMIYFKSSLLYDPLKLKMTNKNRSSFGYFPKEIFI